MKKKRKILRELEDNTTIEIIIDSKKIDFKDGYGVSSYVKDYIAWDDSSYFSSLSCLDVIFTGIVDKKLNVILPHKHYYIDIKNFGDGNFIITKEYNHDNGKQIFATYYNEHIKIINNNIKTITKLGFSDYKIINDTTIIANNRVYDIISGTYTSEQFSNISEFKRHGIDNKKLARAIINLECDNELICYIDTKGNIKSRIISTYDGEEINQNNPDLDLQKEVTRINEKIRLHQHEINKEESLKLNIKL